MERITVQPGGADRRVPVENLRGQYFEHGVPRDVALTPFIQRRLAAGDLVVSPAAPVRASAAPAPSKGEG